MNNRHPERSVAEPRDLISLLISMRFLAESTPHRAYSGAELGMTENSMSSETRVFLRATATLVGMIIGVGFFGVPYVMAQAGWGIGLFYFVLLGGVITLVHLMYGEVILRTTENHRFVGFVEKYCGKHIKRVAVFTSTFGFWTALTAYIILGGRFLYLLLSPIFGGSEFNYQLAFFVILGALIYKGIKIVTKVELILTGVLIFFIIILIFAGLPKVDLSKLALANFSNFFLPYGVILFALSGAPAIPEICDILKGNFKKIKNIILIGSTLAIILTLAFALVAVGAVDKVSEDAISSLASTLGSWVIVIGSLMGFLAVATSFLILGLNLEEQFLYDLHRSKSLSFILAIVVPFVIFLFLTRDFIRIIGFAGAVFTALDTALLIAVWLRARRLGVRAPEYSLRVGRWAGYILIGLFVLGAIYEIINIS